MTLVYPGFLVYSTDLFGMSGKICALRSSFHLVIKYI